MVIADVKVTIGRSINRQHKGAIKKICLQYWIRNTLFTILGGIKRVAIWNG